MAKKEFFLGGVSGLNKLQEQTDAMTAESTFNLKLIPVEHIEANELNKVFSQEDIEPLARSIADIGLQHNLVVLKADNGKYRLISGERRFRAISYLIKHGNKDFANGIPCKVISNVDAVEEEIRLLRANTDTRELSSAEKRNAVLRLLELYKLRQSAGEIKSSYEELAKDLEISRRMVMKYAATTKLIPALEELLTANQLTVTDAAKYSVLDEDSQLQLASIIQKQGKASGADLEEVKRLQAEKEMIKEQLSQKIADLVKEKSSLEQQIEEQANSVNEMSGLLENGNINIEEIVKKKVEAEDKAERLTKQKAELQAKYDDLKREQNKPVVVDEKRMREIKASVRVETALTKMEEEFEALKTKTKIIQEDEELKRRYQTLCNRMNALL